MSPSLGVVFIIICLPDSRAGNFLGKGRVGLNQIGKGRVLASSLDPIGKDLWGGVAVIEAGRGNIKRGLREGCGSHDDYYCGVGCGCDCDCGGGPIPGD